MSRSRPLRALLFDFDGTLIDSYPAIAASVNHVRAHYGLPPLPVAEVRRYVGRGADFLMTQSVPAGTVADNRARYLAHHPSVLRQGTSLMDGARDVLEAAGHLRLLLGLCSNKPVTFTRQLLAWLHIDAYFQVVLGPEDVPQLKPAPDMLQTALQRLKVPAGQALYVGDMTVDIETARAAGVAVWSVATGSNDRATLAAANPDRLFGDLHELEHTLRTGAGERGVSAP
jgi:phosphoglycolate phosphatase